MKALCLNVKKKKNDIITTILKIFQKVYLVNLENKKLRANYGNVFIMSIIIK